MNLIKVVKYLVFAHYIWCGLCKNDKSSKILKIVSISHHLFGVAHSIIIFTVIVAVVFCYYFSYCYCFIVSE